MRGGSPSAGYRQPFALLFPDSSPVFVLSIFPAELAILIHRYGFRRGFCVP